MPIMEDRKEKMFDSWDSSLHWEDHVCKVTGDFSQIDQAMSLPGPTLPFPLYTQRKCPVILKGCSAFMKVSRNCWSNSLQYVWAEKKQKKNIIIQNIHSNRNQTNKNWIYNYQRTWQIQWYVQQNPMVSMHMWEYFSFFEEIYFLECNTSECSGVFRNIFTLGLHYPIPCSQNDLIIFTVV